jgi:hypothetical protein
MGRITNFALIVPNTAIVREGHEHLEIKSLGICHSAGGLLLTSCPYAPKILSQRQWIGNPVVNMFDAVNICQSSKYPLAAVII